MFPLRDDIPSYRPPVVTTAIVVACALVFVLEVLAGPTRSELVFTWGLVPARVVGTFARDPIDLMGWLIPFFTSMFLHGGWFHVIGNLWFLWVFGDNVEDRFGHGRFLFFYVFCGVAAAIVQFLFDAGSRIPMVGASGAIAGVLGAYMIFYPRARVLTFIPIFFIPYLIRVPAVVFLGIWFVEQLLAGGMSLGRADGAGGVAWWAHLGGFACGALLAFQERERGGPGRRRVEIHDDWLDRRRRRRF